MFLLNHKKRVKMCVSEEYEKKTTLNKLSKFDF